MSTSNPPNPPGGSSTDSTSESSKKSSSDSSSNSPSDSEKNPPQSDAIPWKPVTLPAADKTSPNQTPSSSVTPTAAPAIPKAASAPARQAPAAAAPAAAKTSAASGTPGAFGTTAVPAMPPTSATAAPGTPASGTKPTVLALAIKDKAVLFAAYMQFLSTGGLFIPTQRDFQWGEIVTLTLTLMEETEKFTVGAKVVWITPKKAQGNRSPGIGVQFLGDEGKRLRDKMEVYLAGLLDTDKPTHTL